VAPIKETVVKRSIINYRSTATSTVCCVLNVLLICLVNMIASLCVFLLPYLLDIALCLLVSSFSLIFWPVINFTVKGPG